jgi:hypothetical protein
MGERRQQLADGGQLLTANQFMLLQLDRAEVCFQGVAHGTKTSGEIFDFISRPVVRLRGRTPRKGRVVP